MYATYDFYTGTFYGTAITAADFPRLSSHASDFIDYFTRGKAASVTDDSVMTAIKKACCAVAELIQLDENARNVAAATQVAALDGGTGEVKSETVGSWSRSYTTAADYTAEGGKTAQRAARAAYAAIAEQYLANTGLLYRGGCC